MDNPAVQTFSHVGNKNGTGSINFNEEHGHTIAAIEMTRHQDGLWYTTNPVLMPPDEQDTTTSTSSPLNRPHITKTATKTATIPQPALAPIDETKTYEGDNAPPTYDNTGLEAGTPPTARLPKSPATAT